MDGNWIFTAPRSGNYIVTRGLATFHMFPIIPRFKKKFRYELQLKINPNGWYIYCGEDLVNILNIHSNEWVSKKNPKFKVLELLFGC